MILTRLMNLPVLLQRGVAVALALGCAIAPLLLAERTVTVIRNQSAQIQDLRERSGKLVRLAAMKDEVSKLASVPIGAEGGGLLIEAENISIAKANLQSRIGAVAQARGATVSSSGGVPDIEENGLLLIGQRADISGTNEAIEGTLSDIETGKPPLLVREFMLRSEGTALADRPMTLTASIRLYGAVRLAAGAAADGTTGVGAGDQPQ